MPMRKWIVLAFLAAVLVAPVLAQRPGGGGGGGRGVSEGMLLSNKGVQEELKLTEQQKETIAAISAKQRESFGGGKGGKGGKGFDREAFQKAMEESNKAYAKVKEDLKPEQKKRLHQIQTQVQGLRAFSNEEVQSALKLTDKQKEEIKEIADEAGKDIAELRKGGFGKGADREKMAENQKKIAKLNKEATDRIVKTFNTDQQKAWKDLTGEPFEVKFEGFGGDGGGGRPKGKDRGEKKKDI